MALRGLMDYLSTYLTNWSAVRAIADLFDPVLVEHRVAADRGDPNIARRLSTLGRGQDARVMFEVTVALGRLRWSGAPKWLSANLGTPDPTLAHAAVETLRRSRNWSAVLSGWTRRTILLCGRLH